jgi:UDP-N-acetylglucosamine 2-epimerase (non-hydrolysing)
MKKILIVFGTRPEAIKMAPVIQRLRTENDVHFSICITGQHNELIQPVLEFFSITADYNLKIMEQKPTLTSIYSLILQRIETVFKNYQPDLVLVHGDTATTAAVSMAAFLNKIEVGHVEAGLRTGDMSSPWPEEFNRRLVSLTTRYHFAPTASARNNLLDEKIDRKKITVTGNTVIDALFSTLNVLNKDHHFIESFAKKFPFVNSSKRLLLVTMHRRENFGPGVLEFCQTLKEVALKYDDAQIVFPVHLNPNIQQPVLNILSDTPNIFLTAPMEYYDFVFMMQKSYLILTDSGGIQEEAPSLGKPVLVTRTTTERPEAVIAQTVRLVGTERETILHWIDLLMTNTDEYAAMSEVNNPYGDGYASERIVSHLLGRDKLIQVGWFKKTLQFIRGPQKTAPLFNPPLDQ